MNLKKVLGCGLISISLSACHLLPQLQGEVQQPSKVEYSPEQQAAFKKLDEQFERVKKAGHSVEFNGEKYMKQTLAIKGDSPRFFSLAASEDRNNRKTVTSDTSYLKNVALEPQMTQNFFQKNQQTCTLENLNADNQSYYACSGKDFKRYIAVIHKEKNIVSYRAYKAFQQQPSAEEEKNIVNALVRLPLDSIVVEPTAAKTDKSGKADKTEKTGNNE